MLVSNTKQVIHGVCPSKSNCYRIGQHGLFKTKALTEYEKNFFIQCRIRDKNIGGYFEIHLDVYYPNQRADLDNSLKIILDCLQKCKAIVNDNKCTKIVANKFLDKMNPRIEFELREVGLGISER
jgi:Holliday junction resolvase RusA-like endonuclease